MVGVAEDVVRVDADPSVGQRHEDSEEVVEELLLALEVPGDLVRPGRWSTTSSA
jgi:hypothetical protein